jgi:hypothetical protein
MIAPKWDFEKSKYVKFGENTISLEAYNTLVNPFDTILTRYKGDLKSEIIGRCKIKIVKG